MTLRPGPPRLAAGPDTALPGSDYSDDERAFLVAIEGYKRRHRLKTLEHGRQHVGADTDDAARGRIGAQVIGRQRDRGHESRAAALAQPPTIGRYLSCTCCEAGLPTGSGWQIR